jgi:Response regulator receiver domain
VLEHAVGLRSRRGKGSVFFVTAPLGLAALKLRAEPGAPEPVAAGEPLNGLKVLAIDNDPRVMEGMRVLLRRWGCRVATAHGLEEAEAGLDAFGAPDVIIADYHLDSGDGIAAIQAVRRALWQKHSRDPRHRRSKPRGAGRGRARGCRRHEQAAEARAVAGSTHPLQRHAREATE